MSQPMRQHFAAPRGQVIAWNLFLWLITCCVLLPLAWMLLASVSPSGKALSADRDLISGQWTLANYRALFSRLNVGRFLFNSLWLSTVITCISLILNAMAGYALAKLNFRGKSWMFRFVVLILVVPAQVAMLPLFLQLKQMHLIDTYWAIILPASASAYGIFLVRQYALSIQDEMLDAARLDGASEHRIFCQIALPNIVPVLTALGVFTFLTAWNDFMWPLIVLSDEKSFTLPVAIASMAGQHIQEVELMMAAAFVTALPMLIVFVVMQKHLISGIVLGFKG